MAIQPAVEQANRNPSDRQLRYFFPGMAGFALIILLAAFVPEYQRFGDGVFPIAWVLHVHAAIMFGWVGVFALQSLLGATGRTAPHRRVGVYSVGMGWLAWASMIFVEFRVFVAHPLPLNPVEYDWDLPGPFIYLTFAVFLVWAVRERRRPQWHKRLMTFALFLSLGAAFQRFLWIPINYGFGPFAVALDASLIVPMVAYDLTTLKGGLHPATVRATLLLLTSEAVLFALWGTLVWHNFISSVAHWVHG